MCIPCRENKNGYHEIIPQSASDKSLMKGARPDAGQRGETHHSASRFGVVALLIKGEIVRGPAPAAPHLCHTPS